MLGSIVGRVQQLVEQHAGGLVLIEGEPGKHVLCIWQAWSSTDEGRSHAGIAWHPSFACAVARFSVILVYLCVC